MTEPVTRPVVTRDQVDPACGLPYLADDGDTSSVTGQARTGGNRP
ncbi:hypothetical protein [Streptomyces sp. NPDC002324]